MRLASLKDPEEQPDKAAKPDPSTQATSLLPEKLWNSGPGDGKEAEGGGGGPPSLPASGTQEMGAGTGRRAGSGRPRPRCAPTLYAPIPSEQW